MTKYRTKLALVFIFRVSPNVKGDKGDIGPQGPAGEDGKDENCVSWWQYLLAPEFDREEASITVAAYSSLQSQIASLIATVIALQGTNTALNITGNVLDAFDDLGELDNLDLENFDEIDTSSNSN